MSGRGDPRLDEADRADDAAVWARGRWGFLGGGGLEFTDADGELAWVEISTEHDTREAHDATAGRAYWKLVAVVRDAERLPAVEAERDAALTRAEQAEAELEATREWMRQRGYPVAPWWHPSSPDPEPTP